MGLGLENSGDLVELVGHGGGDLVVVADPDQGDQVDLSGDGVDLADAGEVGDGLGDLGDAGDVGLDEDDGGDHALTLGAARSAVTRSATCRPAPWVGQVHSPSTSMSRTPGDSSQRRRHSLSWAVAAGVGPTVGVTVSAEARRASTKACASAPGGIVPAAARRP